MRRRGELVERSFAHMLDTGGQRRTTLRGHANINKRYTLQAAAFNLSLVMRLLVGAGKPRAFDCQSQAAIAALFSSLLLAIVWLTHRLGRMLCQAASRLHPIGCHRSAHAESSHIPGRGDCAPPLSCSTGC